MTTAEQLIETDLTELLGGRTPPDLIARTLERIERGETGARSASERGGTTSESSNKLTPAGRLLSLRRLAVAACALLALGLMTWVLWPQSLPESVTPTTQASYRVKQDHIELKSGWLLLTDGAPEVRVDNGRVNDVRGRAVVGAGIPSAEALDALADELNLSDTEKEMLKLPKRWLTAGGLALCLLTGQAVLNDQLVQADDLPAPQVNEDKTDLPVPEDVDGVKKLFSQVESIELRGLKQDGSYSGWLLVEGDAATKLGSEFGAAIAEHPRAEADWDFENEFWLTLKSGTLIKAAVYNYGELVDIRLPDWDRFEEYTCAATLRDAIKPWVEKAKQIDRYPVRDLPAMRRSMSKAVKVAFRDTYDEGNERSGEITDPVVVARLAELVWPDDVGYSESIDYGRDIFELTFEMSNGEHIRVRVADTGVMHVHNGGALLQENEIAGNASIQGIHKLLAEVSVADTGFCVLREWTGAHSEITKARTQFITDADTWASVWQEHTINPMDDPVNPPKLPDVDFESEVVLCVFGGAGSNSKGYFVQEILHGAAYKVIRVDEHTYQTDSGADEVTPYGIFVLPRTGANIVVEENVQHLLNHHPLWRQTGSLTQAGSGPAAETLWRPTYTTAGVGGDEYDGLYFISDQDDWREYTQDLGPVDALWPRPDFGKVFAVLVLGERMKGSSDKIKLTPLGFSDKQAVLRLERPTTTTQDDDLLENIYAVWLMPRAGREPVIEVEPEKKGLWQEAIVVGDYQTGPGILDYRTGFDGGPKDASCLLVNSQEDFEAATKNVKTGQLPSGWVDWKNETLLVIFPGERRIDAGLVPSESSNMISFVVYTMLKTKGEDTPLRQPWLLIKLRKTTELVVYESDTSNVGQAPYSGEHMHKVAQFSK